MRIALSFIFKTHIVWRVLLEWVVSTIVVIYIDSKACGETYADDGDGVDWNYVRAVNRFQDSNVFVSKLLWLRFWVSMTRLLEVLNRVWCGPIFSFTLSLCLHHPPVKIFNVVNLLEWFFVFSFLIASQQRCFKWRSPGEAGNCEF